MKYILVKWPNSDLLRSHNRFNECLLVSDLLGHEKVGISAFMCPEDLYVEIFGISPSDSYVMELNNDYKILENKIRRCLSAKLMDTSEDNPLKVNINNITEIFQEPYSGIIWFKTDSDILDIDTLSLDNKLLILSEV